MRNKLFRFKDGKSKGQSLVELALIVPLILIMLLGMVEVGFLVFNYLNAVDLSREAARFLSVRDWRSATSGPATMADCTDDSLDYYKDAACFFIDPSLNPNLPLDSARYDDVTISAFVVISGTNSTIARRLPYNQRDVNNILIDPDNDGVWSLYNNNWTKDCHGNVIHTEPVFTNAEVEALFVDEAPKAKGLVLVEAFICYDQMIYIPLLSDFIGSPFRIHTYTFMPAPEAIPTPTAIP